jgi:hypothetical protein
MRGCAPHRSAVVEQFKRRPEACDEVVTLLGIHELDGRLRKTEGYSGQHSCKYTAGQQPTACTRWTSQAIAAHTLQTSMIAIKLTADFVNIAGSILEPDWLLNALDLELNLHQSRWLKKKMSCLRLALRASCFATILPVANHFK